MVLVAVCVPAAGCGTPQAQVAPSIEFTRLPPASEGSADIFLTIEGRVRGARPNQEIVLYAHSGVWWVQPLGEKPFTAIQKDSTWKNSTHPGTEYAALLVDPGYPAPLTFPSLPSQGGPVHAVAVAKGTMSGQLKKLNFSGYEWLVHQIAAAPGGSHNRYDAGNAWIDTKGYLHLRIAADPQGWTSASVNLTSSLGYGSYRFVVSDVGQFEPPVVLNIAVWDVSSPNQEMDIEISRWGEPTGKNSQYVIQPYFIPANVIRFLSPSGKLTFTFDWEPGRISFETLRGTTAANPVASHVFTSGVPPAGNENVRMNLYVFENRRTRLEHGVEVIIEKFEFLP